MATEDFNSVRMNLTAEGTKNCSYDADWEGVNSVRTMRHTTRETAAQRSRRGQDSAKKHAEDGHSLCTKQRCILDMACPLIFSGSKQIGLTHLRNKHSVF